MRAELREPAERGERMDCRKVKGQVRLRASGREQERVLDKDKKAQPERV